MTNHSLEIVIPIAAMCNFLFSFFSFLNARRAKAVHIFQTILITCLIWTFASVMMDLQMSPGINFWFTVSLFGALLMPQAIYCFMFCMLDIPRYNVLGVWTLLSIAGVIVNAIFGVLIEPPHPVITENQQVAYVYTIGPGVYVLILLEIAMLVYVTMLVVKKADRDRKLSKSLAPFLIGMLAILLGYIIRFISQSSIPYDKLGGVVMSVCMAYIMYKQYLYDWSDHMKTGSIYMVAMVLVFAPVYFLFKQVGNYDWLPVGVNRDFILVVVLLMVWCMLVFWTAFKIANNMVERGRQDKFEKVRAFQNETASLFNERELYGKMVEVIEKLDINADVYVFARDMDTEFGYAVVAKGEMAEELDESSMQKIISQAGETQFLDSLEISLLKYDGEIHGFIYLKMEEEARLNYIEEECFQQIGAYASVCLKNASSYQKVYQISIHDELTGLYNREYYKDFIKQYWKADKTQAIIYIDLDDFKLFNEIYGEEVGDQILRWCGVKIREVVANQGATFRLGSNEFIVFTRCVDKDKLRIMALQMQKRVAVQDEAKPKVIQPITLSIGIASYPEAASTPAEHLQQAKKAMSFAKQNGKNRVEIYEKAVDTQELDRRVDKAYEQVAPTIYALTAAIDAKDSYTFEHSCNVSADAVVLASAIGLNSNEIRIAKEAGLLHDIGKIGIPENILKKQARLTDDEYEIMKTHVTNSIEMIHHLPNMDYVIPAVLSHHERYDGKGYPRGLEGEGIPLLGRILAVCDSFDAITSKRSYKEALSKEYAITELERNKGTQFDPLLVDVFVKLVREGKIER